MKYRVENIISTLKRLPEPEYKGQVLKVPVMVATWEHDYTKGTEVFGKGQSSTWLEWVYDI